MKSIIKFITFVLLLVVPFSSALAETSVGVSFDPASGSVVVTGTANGNTVIKALPYELSENNVTSGGQYAHIDQIYTTGTFTYSFYMPDCAPYNKYNVYVVDSGTASDGFIYYSVDMADLIVEELNKKTTASSLADAVATSAAALGIDEEEGMYVSHSLKAADILVPNLMPFADSSDFYNEYHGALAMAAMGGADKSAVEDILFKSKLYLGIDYSAYSALDADHKSDICTLLSSANFKNELTALKQEGKTACFSNILEKFTALSAVRTASNWTELKDAILIDYNSQLGYIVSSNTSYSSSIESDVFIKLKNDGVFDSYTSLKNSFDSSVSYVIQQKGQATPSTRPNNNTQISVSMPAGNVISKNEYDTDAVAPGNETTSQIKTSASAPTLSGIGAAYTDVYETSWEHEAVSALGGNGIIAGYTDGSYRPGNMITRAEFTKLIVTAFGIKANSLEFSDVTESDWYHPYVSVAAGAGIIQGYDGSFNPNSHITREDAAVIIYRLSALLGENYYGTVSFADLDSVSIYALTAVRGLGNAGIINGDANFRFNPKSNLTRAEAAQLIYNFIGKLAE